MYRRNLQACRRGADPTKAWYSQACLYSLAKGSLKGIGIGLLMYRQELLLVVQLRPIIAVPQPATTPIQWVS